MLLNNASKKIPPNNGIKSRLLLTDSTVSVQIRNVSEKEIHVHKSNQRLRGVVTCKESEGVFISPS